MPLNVNDPIDIAIQTITPTTSENANVFLCQMCCCLLCFPCYLAIVGYRYCSGRKQDCDKAYQDIQVELKQLMVADQDIPTDLAGNDSAIKTQIQQATQLIGKYTKQSIRAENSHGLMDQNQVDNLAISSARAMAAKYNSLLSNAYATQEQLDEVQLQSGGSVYSPSASLLSCSSG